jgi:dethiobiotin synthetase
MGVRAVNGGTPRVVVVAGTGTGIGKTHFAQALLRALGALGLRTAGLKPIETGVSEAVVSDAARLDAEATFHVKRSGYALAAPLSPHLATREAQVPPIRLDVIRDLVRAACAQVDVALVELPGGLFTPLTDSLLNADLTRDLAPTTTLLVAPDRLGVLHDVLSTARAASTLPVRIDGVVLSAPELPDPSTGRNAQELRRLAAFPFVAVIARRTVHDLAADDAVRQIAAHIATS